MATSDPAVAREPTGDVFTLADVVDALRTNRTLVLAIVGTCVALAVAFAFLSPKVYRAEAVLLPVSQEGQSGLGAVAGQLGGLASLAGVSLPKDSGRDETLAVLEAKSFVGAFIRDNDLLPTLFPDEWDSAARKWKDPSDAPSVADGVRRFQKDVMSVGDDPASSLVKLRIDWGDRALATRWANELVARLNSVTRTRAIERARESMRYLNDELGKTEYLEGRQALNRLLESQIKTVMVANVTAEYSLRVVDPAVEPDADDYLRPQRALLIVVGFVIGLLLAIVTVVLRVALRRQPAVRT